MSQKTLNLEWFYRLCTSVSLVLARDFFSMTFAVVLFLFQECSMSLYKCYQFKNIIRSLKPFHTSCCHYSQKHEMVQFCIIIGLIPPAKQFEQSCSCLTLSKMTFLTFCVRRPGQFLFWKVSEKLFKIWVAANTKFYTVILAQIAGALKTPIKPTSD